MKNIKRIPESELEIMQIIWKEETPVSRMTIERALQDSFHLGKKAGPIYMSRS